MLGGFLALLAAATFALNNATVRRGVLTGSVSQAMAITVPLGVPMFLVAAAAAGALGAVFMFSAEAIFWLSIAGVAHFVWSRYCNYRATKAMGANLVAPIQQSSLIVTLVLAIWILGEFLTPLRALGIVLVLLGAALVNRRRKRGSRPVEPQPTEQQSAEAETGEPLWQPNYPEGYLFAVLSTTGYGVSPILIRLAVEDAGLGASLAAGLISSVAATVVIAAVVLWPGQLRHVLAVDPIAARWFGISGVLVCLSQIFRYMSLAVAPVSVVTPIQRLSVVFRLIFAWMLNRQHEVFGGSLVLGTFVSLLGALALSVSTEAVVAVVPLPDFILSLSRWRWP